MIKQLLHTVLHKQVSIAPLVTFRILFGLLMFISILRFWWNGWIETQFIEPIMHFKFFGFHWVPDPNETVIYWVFALMAVSALFLAAGFFYRIATFVFFVLFTYVELIDATYYLNHYYFVSLVALIMIFMPANKSFSLDEKWHLTGGMQQIPVGFINLLKFQLGLVYFFAGVAKLNADWLIEAMPLAIWLPAQNQLPLIGGLFSFKLSAYVFSWAGMLYDLFIPFFLLIDRTRGIAYVAVIAFHLLTWSMFQIGMFPFIMIGLTLIFFSSDFHQRMLTFLGANWKRSNSSSQIGFGRLAIGAVGLFMLIQIAMPFRNLVYPGSVFWHEQGYRFGWRVMLTEKAGYAQFKVFDGLGRALLVDNQDFLTPVQEKMMSTQPDMMLQYAAFLEDHYQREGVDVDGVKADVHVTYNGRSSRQFIDPDVNLAALEDNWNHKNWIIPMNR